MQHVQTPIRAEAATEPGALDGYRCECSCGLVMSSSLHTLLVQDAAAHAAWHERKGGR